MVRVIKNMIEREENKLSVCISAFDQHEVTVAHVKGCMESTVVPYEIIVVNDHGDKSLREMLLEIERKCPITYAYVENDIPWNYTGARNLGVWLSKGEFLAMEDTDHIPHPEFYEQALKLLEDRPEVGRVLSKNRLKVRKEEVIKKPVSECEEIGTTTFHRDTQILRRDTFLRMKGCDEQFAGAYAWACTDWRRRLNRAGIISDNIGHYYLVVGAETQSLVHRKSYRNYELARKKTHIQSPKGILNFTYTFERYD